MKVTFWGVRGSFPVTRADALGYGGNTACVQIDTHASTIIIDAGTGIRPAGRLLVERSVRQIDILISHTHWDHIQGFPFFAPLYQSDTSVRVYGLKRHDHNLEDVFGTQQSPLFSSMPRSQITAQVEFVELEDGEEFHVQGCDIRCNRLNHPGVTCGYRVEHDGAATAYISDTDIFGNVLLGDTLPMDSKTSSTTRLERQRDGTRRLSEEAGLMICDTFFQPNEYDPNWGHSRPDDAIQLASESGARRVALFHHRPERSDNDLNEIRAIYQEQAPGEIEVLAAHEKQEVVL